MAIIIIMTIVSILFFVSLVFYIKSVFDLIETLYKVINHKEAEIQRLNKVILEERIERVGQ